MQGYAALQNLGAQALTGFSRPTSAPVRSRRSSQALALSATVGCGFTAQLEPCGSRGDRRARGHGRPVGPVPGHHPRDRRLRRRHPAVRAGPARFLRGLENHQHGVQRQSTGGYDHYFSLFLPPEDVLWSFGKVLIFAFVIILVHCYYGYFASGGPPASVWPWATRSALR